MIITLKGADFSKSNVGTLSTWLITKSLKGVTTTSTVTSVDKDGSYTATFTVNDGYTWNSCTVTMGGTDISSMMSWNTEHTTGTITISKVTGNVYINIVAVSESGEEVETLDSIAYENLTYRDIFITNNYAPNVNNNSMSSSKGGTYSDSAGSTSIVSDETASDNYVPPYSLYISGTSSQQAKSTVNDTSTNEYFLAANIKITSYTKGYCGMIFGSNFDACASSVTEGYEVFTTIGNAHNTSGSSTSQFFIGSASSANLTGYINNPVAVKMSVFTTAPSLEELTALYKKYTALLIAGNK